MSSIIPQTYNTVSRSGLMSASDRNRLHSVNMYHKLAGKNTEAVDKIQYYKIDRNQSFIHIQMHTEQARMQIHRGL